MEEVKRERPSHLTVLLRIAGFVAYLLVGAEIVRASRDSGELMSGLANGVAVALLILAFVGCFRFFVFREDRRNPLRGWRYSFFGRTTVLIAFLLLFLEATGGHTIVSVGTVASSGVG